MEHLNEVRRTREMAIEKMISRGVIDLGLGATFPPIRPAVPCHAFMIPFPL
jgi:hypothetical protein